MERNAGTTIFGRLELIREEASSVGVQVFGPTWAVLDSETGELARACFLDAELLPDAASRDAFVAGLEVMTSLRDPTLVPQIYAGADPHGGAVVYEALAGGVSFDDLYDGTGSFDLSSEVGRLARQLARALASLHARGQVHGLLTSACVFVGSRGPAVYQFGLAPLCDRTVLLRRVRAFGLPNLAPEVVAGGPFTPVADLYAWAVTVAQFAAGARGAEAIAAARGGQELPGLSPALRSAVQACLSDDPAARPRDGGELLRLIELAGLGEGSGALRPEDPAPVPEDSSPEAEAAAPPVPEASPEVAPASEPTTVASEPTPASEPAPASVVAEPATIVTPSAEPTPEPPPAAVSEPAKPISTSIPTPTGPPISAPIAAPTAASVGPSVPTVTPPTASPMTPTLPTSGRPFVPPSPPIVPTIPNLPSSASGTRPMPPPPTLRPSAAAAKGPPTIPPSTGASLPITSFEEMLTTGDRQRRPATIPPPSSTAAPTPAPPGASASSVRAVIELSPEDMLSESGQWKPGGQPSNKSASNLRRVRVLTDPINREGSGLINLARAPQPEDLANVPETPAQRRTGEVIIGGTREELDAASKATTLRLDPMNAAAAVQAATEAAAAAAASQSAAARAADSSLTSLAGDSKTEGSSSSLAGLSGQAEATPDISRPTGAVPAASDQAGTPSMSSSSRRRSSAVSSSASGSGEPRDWGTIPPIADLVPTAPTAVEPARPNLPATQDTRKLVPILVVVAIALIVLIFVAR